MVSRMLLIGQILLSAVTRRGTEALLRSSEEKYRTVVDSQSDLICRYLPDTTLTFVNEAYCRYFGSARRADRPPVSRPAAGTLSRPGAAARPVAGRESQGRSRGARGPAPDGSVGWLRWSEHAIFAPDGRIVEFQGIGRDITDRKRMQEARSGSPAPRGLTVGELATSIAHEIRQPLGAILANTEAAQLMLDSGTG
jgi:PAS domain-containing protein